MKKIIMMLLVIVLGASIFVGCGTKSSSGEKMKYSNEKINWYGRTYENTIGENKMRSFNHTASGFEVKFVGTSLEATFYANITSYGAAVSSIQPYISVFIDDDNPLKAKSFAVTKGEKTITLADGLENKEHTIKVLKRTEQTVNSYGDSALGLINISTDGTFKTPTTASPRKIEFFGDSITAGYGMLAQSGANEFTTSTEDGVSNYAGLTSYMLDTQFNSLTASGWAMDKNPWNNNKIPQVFNQIDFSNSTAWDFNNYVTDVAVINLGTNDNARLSGLTGNALVTAKAEYLSAYKEFVQKLLDTYSNVKVVCIYGGLMCPDDAPVYDGFKEMLDSMKADGKEVYSLKLNAFDGYQEDMRLGHPGKQTNKAAAKQLAAYISQITGWTQVNSIA